MTKEQVRILDQDGNELTEGQIDYSKGHLETEEVFVAHHEAIEAIPQQEHYFVQSVFFDVSTDNEGNKYYPEDWYNLEDGDPRIEVIDAQSGAFNIVDKTLNVRGMVIKKVVDVEGAPAKDAYDEKETIKRYIPFTTAELEEQEKTKKQEKIRESLVTIVPALEESVEQLQVDSSATTEEIENVNAALDEIAIAIAEMVGE